MQRYSTLLAALLIGSLASASDAPTRRFPLPSGEYKFQVADAEFDGKFSYAARATIQGMHINVVVTECGGPLPCNEEFVDGTLFWHKRSRQWIIATTPEDFDAKDVGGCSDGPFTIDPKRRIVWYC